MRQSSVLTVGKAGIAGMAGLLLLLSSTPSTTLATDWPQYRGPTTDGVSPDPILTTWPAAGPKVVWTNTSLTNGFSSVAVSQGRAFAMISRVDSGGILREYCAAVDAATGTNLWATPIDFEPWSPAAPYDGGAGASPYWYTGDGPRTTPSVAGNRVIAFSGLLHLVCLDATSGSVVWSNNLVSAFGGSTIPWDNAASPCIDNDLVFVNLHTAPDNKTLAAFRISDGGLQWASQTEGVTHATPIVATIEGVRQAIFATQTGLVSLDRSSGAFLWKFTYPFFPISTSMGASPVVYSNIVYCTAGYGRGATAARITLANGIWNVQQLYYKTSFNYRSIWMSPVCFQGYIYTLCGENSTYLTPPLNCIELATGDLKWSTNNFGMGGLILVNTNLLVLTEDGQLVLVQPSPDAYQELARYQAFQFNASSLGKCWNSPSFSNGRIYARSTTGAICLDVSVQGPPPLQLFSPQIVSSTELQLLVGTADGTPIDSARLAKIRIRANDAFGAPRSSWPALTNQMTLDGNGVARMAVTVGTDQPRQFYTAAEEP